MVSQTRTKPDFVPPMLLQRVQHCLKDWQYEVKWDGYRMQAIKNGNGVRLFSRNGADFTRRFSGVAAAVERLKPRTLHIDGELVAMDRQGRPSFQVLQGGLPLPDGWRFGFYAFDCLNLEGRCLRHSPLSERRARLQEVIAGSGLRFSPTLKGQPAVLRAVSEQRLEGVVAKRAESVYEAGKRSGAWVKLPLKQRGTFLVGGYRWSGKSLATILVGHVDSGRFLFAGKIQVALHNLTRFGMLEHFKNGQTRNCPFANLPNVKQDPFNESVTPEEMPSFAWVRPEMPVEVAFHEWTSFGVLRQAEIAG